MCRPANVSQNRMLDLKYSMQHLLARMLHKSNPKASLKAVDGMIQDVEAYVIPLVSRQAALMITQVSTCGLGVCIPFPSSFVVFISSDTS